MPATVEKRIRGPKRAKRPRLTTTLLDAISDNPVEDVGEAPPGLAPDHEVPSGYKYSFPLCCQLAIHAKPVKDHPAMPAVLKSNSFANLIATDYDEAYLDTPLFLAGKLVHSFDCSVFLKALPEGHEGRAEWQFALGYFPVYDLKTDWRMQHELRIPRDTGKKSTAWNLFLKWTEQYDATESLERYVKLALLTIAQAQYEKMGQVNMPESYTARMVATFSSDTTFAYLYEADYPAPALISLKLFGKLDPSTHWPTIKRRKIPFDPIHGLADLLLKELQPADAPKSGRD
ncbi:hypothetical protein CDD81_4043 [Ophiocordyceps australis]|uniref:Uncharacterized protein n=1 Tax=Ophiocordyceps australis TaxID=1399860 RepID=A0A2C5YD35_9HYPO|nr:hypothetical protein CDD81_4043 [Ophiocordyceps australis]